MAASGNSVKAVISAAAKVRKALFAREQYSVLATTRTVHRLVDTWAQTRTEPQVGTCLKERWFAGTWK